MAEVPEPRYRGVDDLIVGAKRLAAGCDVAHLDTTGVSGREEPIHCLRIDGGLRHVVVVGWPHDVEWIGAARGVQLETTLCSNPGLRELLGCTCAHSRRAGCDCSPAGGEGAAP